MTLAWSSRVSDAFQSKVRVIAASLGIDPSWLMACMASSRSSTRSTSVDIGKRLASALIAVLHAASSYHPVHMGLFADPALRRFSMSAFNITRRSTPPAASFAMA